jgi:SulP family sulfate permease
VAVHIAIGQLRHLLGLDVPAMPELYRIVGALVAGVGQTNMICVALGLATSALVVALGWLGRRVPAALVAIVGAGLACWLLGLEQRGVAIVGAMPRSLPPLTWTATDTLPDLAMVRALLVGTMAVTALGLIEAVAASQTLARRTGERLDSNQEFFGQGLANVAVGLFSGYPCSGSFTRSALAQQSGARTHLTGVFTGLAVLAGMLLFAPWARMIPKPALAGVLLVIAWRMVDREGIRRVLRTSRAEAAVMILTFCATMSLPLEFAVLAGVVLAGVVFSLAVFVVRSSLSRVDSVVPDGNYRHFVHEPSQPVCPQLGLLDIRGPLFFGAVHHIEEELRHNLEAHPGQHNIVLRLHGVDMCDLSGIEMLESTVRTYRNMGGDVFIVGPRRQVMKVMESSGFLDQTLGRDHLLDRERAIEYLFDQVLDPAVCTVPVDREASVQRAVSAGAESSAAPRPVPSPGPVPGARRRPGNPDLRHSRARGVPAGTHSPRRLVASSAAAGAVGRSAPRPGHPARVPLRETQLARPAHAGRCGNLERPRAAGRHPRLAGGGPSRHRRRGVTRAPHRLPPAPAPIETCGAR